MTLDACGEASPQGLTVEVAAGKDFTYVGDFDVDPLYGTCHLVHIEETNQVLPVNLPPPSAYPPPPWYLVELYWLRQTPRDQVR